jgi:hypothetical protein
MRIKRTNRPAPAPVVVSETNYYRVFRWENEDGTKGMEIRQRVIIRDADGVLRRAYRRETVS